MTPYPRGRLTEPARMFNCCLSRGRKVIYSVFGILAGKQEILNKPIEISDMADKTVRGICVLHNTVIVREGLDEASISLGTRKL
jgi:hypothetical protein